MHDDHREEIEIKCAKDQFNNLKQLFLALGYSIEIKWIRKRNTFSWEDITVCLDYTKGYGYIIELEQMATKEEQSQVFEKVKEKLFSLGVEPTAKEEFAQKYQRYKENWQSLL